MKPAMYQLDFENLEENHLQLLHPVHDFRVERKRARLGQVSLMRSGSTSQGGNRAPALKNGVRVTDPAINSMSVADRHAALAFFAAAVRG